MVVAKGNDLMIGVTGVASCITLFIGNLMILSLGHTIKKRPLRGITKKK